MLCTFGRRQDLADCLTRIRASPSFDFSEILLFQAQPSSSSLLNNHQQQQQQQQQGEDEASENTAGESGGGMFGMAWKKNGKVQLLEDWRSLEDLRDAFPAMKSSGRIEEVWKKTQNWNACFDILSSIVKSHGVCIVQECDLVFDDAQWPALTLTPFVLAGNSQSRASRTSSGEWTLVSLESNLSSLTLYDSLPLPPAPPAHASLPDVNNWEFVQATSTTTAIVKGVRSYREVLLANKESLEAYEEEKKHQAFLKVLHGEQEKKEWKPLLVIKKVSNVRVDREYVNSLEQDRDEEEEEMYWDVCCDAKFASTVSVSAKRKGGVVHMRPAMLDQKLKRIALKTK